MIDCSQVCQGWIYTITNKVNGKMYVGQTINIKKRRFQHFETEETCPLLKKAFAKYGIDNFEMNVVLTFKAINRKVCDEILDGLEIFYIDKYKTFGTGYNVTKGGGGHYGHSPSEETRRKLSEYNTGNIASDESKIKMSKSRRQKDYLGILQYDLDGNFVKEYPCASIASLEIAGTSRYSSTICRIAAKDKHKKIIGFKWRFKESNTIPPTIEPYVDVTQKDLYYYSKDGELLGIYKNAAEASKATGVPKGTIYSSLRYSSTNSKDTRNYITKNYWSHKSSYIRGVNNVHPSI